LENHASDITGIALITSIAVACGLALTRLKQPSIVGYILAGVVLGPTGLGLVKNAGEVALLAELGVLMLLFLIGLEISLRAFVSVLSTAAACAGLQIALSLLAAFAVGWALGWPPAQSLLIGFLMSLSSTAVAIRMLQDVGELRSETGRVTVGVLVAQDLAVVPMLILIGALGGGEASFAGVALKVALAVALLGFVIWFLSRRQRLVLPTSRWLKGQVDLIPLAALAFCFTAATLSGLAGLSPAYGAFIAGLIVANSTDRAVTIRATQPIQSVLLVVFFLSIGLLIDLGYIWRNLGAVLAILLFTTVIKTAINVGALKLLGQPWERAFPAGVVMGQIGEFSFVLAAAGLAAKAIDSEGYRLAIAVIALSLLFSPLWLVSARRFHEVAARGVSSLRLALAEVYRGEIGAARRLYGVGRHGVERAWRRADSTFRRRRPAEAAAEGTGPADPADPVERR
jgi:CPA2 family monovalent cation:H+ antiporter-2